MSVKSQLKNLEEGDTFRITGLGESDDSGNREDFKGKHTITKKSKYLTNNERGTIQKIKERFQIEFLGEDFALETENQGRSYELVIGDENCAIVHLDSGGGFFITEVET